MPIKIILVEDHDIVRQGVRSLLENDPEIDIVAEATNGIEALEICSKMQVDVAVIDINMPKMNGVDCTRIMKKQFPGIKVLILSMHNDEHYLVDVLQAGAEGYILKDSCRNELGFAIRKINFGGLYIDPEFTLSILGKYMSGISNTRYTGPAITEGEIQVLDLIAQGLTNTQMANKLFISVRTIESRRKKLLEKTGTVNTATLMKFAIKHGLLK